MFKKIFGVSKKELAILAVISTFFGLFTGKCIADKMDYSGHCDFEAIEAAGIDPYQELLDLYENEPENCHIFSVANEWL